MPACPKCEEFYRGFKIATPQEYRALAGKLIGMVGDGTFQVMQATCPLEEVLSPVFPDDMLEHVFRCATCGMQYRLLADTYHGHAEWLPLEWRFLNSNL